MKVYDLSLWWLIMAEDQLMLLFNLYMHLHNNIGGSRPEQRWEIALTSHQFGACSSPKGGNTWGLSLLVTFCSCIERWNFLHSHTPTPGFLSPQKAHFQIPIPPGREEKDALFVCTTTTKALFIFTNQHCFKSAKERSLSMDLESGVTFPNVTSVKRYPNHCPFKMEKNPLGKF